MKKTDTPFVETLWGMAALSLAGGFLDAYSFTVRGGILATAQTGNMVFLCVSLANGNFLKAMSYLVPISAFAIGIVMSRFAERAFLSNKQKFWRAYVLIFEIFILFLVSVITDSFTASALISFMCGVQLTVFRVANGSLAATTMCTGNLRCCVDAGFEYCTNKNKAALKLIKTYLIIILAFLLGAVVAAVSAPMFGIFGVVFACVPLLFVAIYHLIVD